MVCTELVGGAEAPGLPPAALSVVLQAWRSMRGLPRVALPALLQAAAAVGLMPRLGSPLCLGSRCGTAQSPALMPCLHRPLHALAACGGTPTPNRNPGGGVVLGGVDHLALPCQAHGLVCRHELLMATMVLEAVPLSMRQATAADCGAILQLQSFVHPSLQVNGGMLLCQGCTQL